MTTLTWIGIGLVLLVVAAIAEAVMKKGRSRPLSKMAPSRYRNDEIKQELGMEATDVKAVNAAIRQNHRAGETQAALIQGTKGLRSRPSAKK